MNRSRLLIGLGLLLGTTATALYLVRSHAPPREASARSVGVGSSDTEGREDSLASNIASVRGPSGPHRSSEAAASDAIPSAQAVEGGTETEQPTRGASNAQAKLLSLTAGRVPDAAQDPPSLPTRNEPLGSTPEGKDMEEALLKQLRPLLRTCVEQEDDRSGNQTDANLSFHITIAPGIGAVVHSVTLEAGVIDPAFAQCIQESVGSIAPFDADGPPERVLSVPLSFGGHDE